MIKMKASTDWNSNPLVLCPWKKQLSLVKYVVNLSINEQSIYLKKSAKFHILNFNSYRSGTGYRNSKEWRSKCTKMIPFIPIP